MSKKIENHQTNHAFLSGIITSFIKNIIVKVKIMDDILSCVDQRKRMTKNRSYFMCPYCIVSKRYDRQARLLKHVHQHLLL
jgi:hypothetical protein